MDKFNPLTKQELDKMIEVSLIQKEMLKFL